MLKKTDLAFAVTAIWAAVAAILITHFHFYYGVGWQNAIKWGTGDGFLWSALLCAYVYTSLRYHTLLASWKTASLFVGLAVLGSVCLHPTVSTLLFWGIDGSISRPFLDDVTHLAMKRLPQGILAGLVIAMISIVAARIRHEKVQPLSTTLDKDLPDPQASVWLCLKSADGVRRLNSGEIRYAEAAGNYVSFHTKSGAYLERMTLKALEEKLAGFGFQRISRKHLVNLDCVRALQSKKPKGGVIILDDGLSLFVSRQYKAITQKAISEHQ